MYHKPTLIECQDNYSNFFWVSGVLEVLPKTTSEEQSDKALLFIIYYTSFHICYHCAKL